MVETISVHAVVNDTYRIGTMGALQCIFAASLRVDDNQVSTIVQNLRSPKDMSYRIWVAHNSPFAGNNKRRTRQKRRQSPPYASTVEPSMDNIRLELAYLASQSQC